ncbi:hypothetical protein V1268_002050 [Enterococcus hirae]|uniref:hypothetical protein n=1 Tax=Enterococcus TaxID=1350 RepID=UPI0003305187|nr:hypothetical protein [Enterococcus hirae]EMF0060931.1 hypothetical protein [Enterococcus hirae]EMF0090170.1 hypothetical protein [Enterococcus hirae]EMF0129672.1 hypothetical protein [Enterococcus hirae]EMF0180910.1 hypothetical protein [Enterococcus hirae]EMF0197328.1 hypothetical protein [Enterococcus hirae]
MKNKFILSLDILTIGISVSESTISGYASTINEPSTVADSSQELTLLDKNVVAKVNIY